MSMLGLVWWLFAFALNKCVWSRPLLDVNADWPQFIFTSAFKWCVPLVWFHFVRQHINPEKPLSSVHLQACVCVCVVFSALRTVAVAMLQWSSQSLWQTSGKWGGSVPPEAHLVPISIKHTHIRTHTRLGVRPVSLSFSDKAALSLTHTHAHMQTHCCGPIREIWWRQGWRCVSHSTTAGLTLMSSPSAFPTVIHYFLLAIGSLRFELHFSVSTLE